MFSCEYSGCWAGGGGEGMGVKGGKCSAMGFHFPLGRLYGWLLLQGVWKKVNVSGGHCGERARESHLCPCFPTSLVLLVCEKCLCPSAWAYLAQDQFGSKQTPGPAPNF